MKKNLLFLTFSLFALSSNAQTDDKEVAGETPVLTYNKWTVEATFGQSKGVRPYTEGYFTSNPGDILGTVKPNYFNAGVRYMFTPSFGAKLDASFDTFQNNEETASKPFEVNQLRFGLQGVVNMARLLNIQNRLGRFGFLVHAGFEYSRVTPQLDTPFDPIGGFSNEGRTENNLGIIVGVTPQFRLLNKLALIADVSTVANFRQHFAWDGHYAESEQNLTGQMIMASIGLSYSLGGGDVHGDWAIIENEGAEEIADLDKRIGELETMMNDSDKDGVPDYLDVEPNSVAGVAVDSKGRMVDANGNGVPDELEKYIDSTVSSVVQNNGGNNSDVIKRLINEGYIAVFFDFGSSRPTPASTQNINFILNYMRQNPSSSADISGYADEIGSTAFNNDLSAKRASFIRNTLIKAGIDAGRLNIVPVGEDTSVDKDSEMARRLVRKVIFMIK
ncbi:MAG TPA: OmpA family protein [Flavobacterium sp.]|jgi:OOP family OmpA-OmpF porin